MEDICLRAFSSGYKEEALHLLKEVKHPREVKGSDGWTLLHEAAGRGWTDIVELLITKYNCNVNSVDNDNITPVYWASFYGQLNVIKSLCNTGKCDLFIKTKRGYTPLDIARRRGHHETVEYLTTIVTTTSTLTCK